MRDLLGFFAARRHTITTVLLRLVVVLVLLGGLFLVLREVIGLGAISPSNQGQGKAITLPTQPSQSTNPATLSGLLRVHSNQIVDASGHTVVLRGAHVTSAFGYVLAWKHGADPFNALNPEVFATMQQQWSMNVVRIPISYWVYLLSPKSYLSKLDTVIQEANAAKLYVVLNNRDDDQAGSPYGTNASLPKPETITLWKMLAGHYKSNPMVMFDIFNEPAQTSWAQWLHGGGTVKGSTGKSAPVIGMQDVVKAVRSVAAQQIIIAEASTEMEGFYGIGNDLLQDPNVMYSMHEYFDWKQHNQDRSPAGWDIKFGSLSATHPVLVGEWAFLPNANHIVFCEHLTTGQADQLVQLFLTYMQQHHVSWTAWDFDLDHLILNYTNFTPTTLNTHWHCGNMSSDAGMGSIIKNYLTTA